MLGGFKRIVGKFDRNASGYKPGGRGVGLAHRLVFDGGTELTCEVESRILSKDLP